MPIYDYRCDHCQHVFSAVQAYTDDTLEVCPSCGKKPRKLMAMPAIVFKGGGWYKTDSRPKGSESGAPDTSGAKIAAGGDAAAKDGGATQSGKTDKTGKSEGAAAGTPKESTSGSGRSERASAEPKKAEPAKSDPGPAKKDSSSS